ncbi:MAG: 2,3-epoxybenzoyl-CoA dihydrolase, partial [Burkholderiales bacterium]
MITFDTHPEKYNHWKLSVDGPVATLTLDIQEDKGLFPTYKLKLNSYDLGVDIELNDALNRVRFEHPGVKTVVMTSGKPRMFCSGANIYMLGQSTHAWKVNFCKFTNETRNGIEDSSRHSGLKFLAALNGATAGGGYELALACDEIAMIDDRSSAVSLPEVPLLGVLPGTGGLTRLVDKRKMRRDLADVFCTTSEGVRADRAKEWRLVDHVAKPQAFAEMVKARALELAKLSDRPDDAKGVALTPRKRVIDDKGYHYEHVEAAIDRGARTATITVKAPQGAQPATLDALLAQGDQWWPLAMARDLDDAILLLRTNDAEVGTWVLKTEGSAQAVLAADKVLASNQAHWFVRETIGFIRRTFSRIDVASRSLIALVDAGSCFAGTLAELAFAADRSYMLDLPDDPSRAPKIALSAMNFGPFEMANHRTRIATRFSDEATPIERCRSAIGEPLDASAARELGLVTITPDDLDWADE